MRLTKLVNAVFLVTLAIAATNSVYATEPPPVALKPDVIKGQAIAGQVCAACHQADGNSSGGAYPKLAGQHPEYLYKQLKDFKAQPGKDGKMLPAARSNPVMAGIVANLSDLDMLDVAAYFSTQKTKPGHAKRKEWIALGEKIYRGGIASKGIPACAACHGPNGTGLPAEFPHLSGQWAEYTQAQLEGFANHSRNNGATMTKIAERMSQQEINAVSDYIAGLH